MTRIGARFVIVGAALSAAALLGACATTGGAKKELPHGVAGTVDLNGAATPVLWDDGDTFTFTEGPARGTSARLMGVNTLETYGPVHRWGQWTAVELHDIAAASGAVSARVGGACRASGKRDLYKRLLVDCPDIRRTLLHDGHGHLYPFDREADPAEIAIQAEAQAERRGMWAKGVPDTILVTLRPATMHNGWSAANWTVDAKDGHSKRIGHRDEYAVCQEVCMGRISSRSSCLTYVPYEQRYGPERASCLR